MDGVTLFTKKFVVKDTSGGVVFSTGVETFDKSRRLNIQGEPAARSIVDRSQKKSNYFVRKTLS
jgi:hypothetical protein